MTHRLSEGTILRAELFSMQFYIGNEGEDLALTQPPLTYAIVCSKAVVVLTCSFLYGSVVFTMRRFMLSLTLLFVLTFFSPL